MHVYTVFATYSPTHALSLLPSPSHWYQPPGRTYSVFCPPILWFCIWKKKKQHFCLLRIVTQRVSLWHFHIYVYIYIYITLLVHFLYFSFFYLKSPNYGGSAGFKILYSFSYSEYMNPIHLLNILLLHYEKRLMARTQTLINPSHCEASQCEHRHLHLSNLVYLRKTPTTSLPHTHL
jgi:hypothetical protein